MNEAVRPTVLATAIPPRVELEEARSLFAERTPARLYELRALANAARVARHGRHASFVDNLQINPSNVCVRDCKFCGFAAKPGEDHAYVQSEEEILAAVETHAPNEVHIVGGLNHEWGYRRSPIHDAWTGAGRRAKSGSRERAVWPLRSTRISIRSFRIVASTSSSATPAMSRQACTCRRMRAVAMSPPSWFE